MAWIESHQELKDHPKTKKLARKLSLSIPATVGHLHFFWWWAMDYAEDGDLSKYDKDDIADACGWEGDTELLCSALIDSGFLEYDEGLFIHDWNDYAGRLLDKRRANTERKRKSRKSHTRVTRDTIVSHGATEPNQTVPNQTKPKDTTIPPHADESINLESSELNTNDGLKQLEEAYCKLHSILPMHVKSKDFLCMQSLIAGGMPFPFINQVMHSIFADKQDREGSSFRPPKSFTYYESAIREAWELENLKRTGGGTDAKEGHSGRSKYHGRNQNKNQAATVSDDELDKLLQESSEMLEMQ